MNTSISSLKDFSLSYNHLYYESPVVRDSYLDEIKELATGENKIIVVEGTEGIGKTSMLLQFVKRNNFTCFSYFINQSCSSTYRQDYLMEDIGKQIFFYLNSESPDQNLIITESIFNNLILELLKSSPKRNKPIYFVIDGKH